VFFTFWITKILIIYSRAGNCRLVLNFAAIVCLVKS
jgi:hypothetical protein